jgi:hypothetical protein
MSSSAVDLRNAAAKAVAITEDTLSIELTDGRTISAPLGWHPRLASGADAEHRNWRFIGGGSGIHWPDLDDDVSVANLLAGQPSAESQTCSKGGSTHVPSANGIRRIN